MAAKWIELLTGPLEQKKQYRQARARMENLPEPYRATAMAVHRYALASGAIVDGDALAQMFTDLADLWERASIDGTPIDALVGDDPVAFVEDFTRAYGAKQWIDKERVRLTEAVDRARREDDRS